MLMQVLFEDFQGFKIGDFPYEPFLGAMGEYHYRPEACFGGRWFDPTPIMGSGAVKTWMVVESHGRKCLEYSYVTGVRPKVDDMVMLTTGEMLWDDYKLSGDIRPLLTTSRSGLIFRYQNSLCFYMFGFNNHRLELFKRNQTELTVLAEQEYDYVCDEFYHFEIECKGSLIICSINGKKVFEVTDDEYPSGKIAFGTMAPAQFTAISVELTPEVQQRVSIEKRRRQKEEATLRAEYPQPRLWKTIDFKDFGAGRNVRFGHLFGGDEWQLVVAQCQRRIVRDAYSQISCLTALDLDGNVLWQLGEASSEHCFLTADLPFQLCDIDGDGKDEVIMSRDFKIYILDGATGKVKKSAPTPMVSRPGYPFDRLNVDAIKMCDFSGKGHPTDILIKDRYAKVWVFNSELEFLWTYDAPVNTGHFPYTKDINGDGREEIFIGYDLLDADGNRLWSLPVPQDHTDEILIGEFAPGEGERIAIVSGSEGFMMADLNGQILVKDIIGHAQRISAGNYCPELPGLQLCVSTFWGNQGIIYLYDCHGKRIWVDETITNGNVITPVNWRGDGEDLILLNGSTVRGGLIDGHNRIVVLFPNDGHPELCAEVMDLTGDCRDELVLWDEHKMYIYTQDDVVSNPIATDKYPHYNSSNYRGEYSYPKSKKQS